MSYLDDDIAQAQNNGLGVIIDLHNFGRYGSEGDSKVVGSVEVPISALENFWVRMSDRYKDNSAVVAYLLMTEPYNLPIPTTPSNYLDRATVTNMHNQVIQAIRDNGEPQLRNYIRKYFPNVMS